MSASTQDGSYPRPQLCRPGWRSLDGIWDFADDHRDVGIAESWYAPTARDRFDRQIVVPFPPESDASKIADTGPHPVVWYRREVWTSELRSTDADTNSITLLHFGAVDYRADVWLDGHHLGAHVGGQSPFTVDLTHLLDDTETAHSVVVRAQDDPHDASQPRGKQTWQSTPSKVWYDRTTGIWQTVWTETVPPTHITELWWRTDPDRGVVADVEFNAPAPPRTQLTVEIVHDGRRLGLATVEVTSRRARVTLAMDALSNGIDREGLLWSPENPVLLDATVTLVDGATGRRDEVESYVGVRTVSVGGGRFHLNGRPYDQRAVLNQGFREATLLANTGTDQLRAEIELAKSMGFNAMRLHQKAEDPRILYWADRLGLLVWGEIGATYEFTSTAMEELTIEWLSILRRDRSHPSVVVWVPVNESWGFPDLAVDAAQRSFATGIANLTRAMDPTRPAMSNEGWEHVDSDILGVHDYSSDPVQLAAHLAVAARPHARVDVPTDLAAGRTVALTASQVARFDTGSAPLMLTEFGGLSLRSDDEDFTYHHVDDTTALHTQLNALFTAVRTSPGVAGFCYTQLYDTAQERNGLADAAGRPKLPIGLLFEVVTGSPAA